MNQTKLMEKLERASRAVAEPGYQSVFAVGKSQPIEHGQHILYQQKVQKEAQRLHALALYISAFEVGRAFEQIDSLERLAEMEDDRG